MVYTPLMKEHDDIYAHLCMLRTFEDVGAQGLTLLEVTDKYRKIIEGSKLPYDVRMCKAFYSTRVANILANGGA